MGEATFGTKFDDWARPRPLVSSTVPLLNYLSALSTFRFCFSEGILSLAFALLGCNCTRIFPCL